MVMGRRSAALLLLVLLQAGLPLALARPAAARASEVPTRFGAEVARAAVAPEQPRILVHFRALATQSERERAIATVGGVVDRELWSIGVTRVALPIAATPAQDDQTGLAALRLAGDPAVVSVEPDSTGAVQFTPNDSLFLTDPQFGLGQWGLRKTLVDRTWDVVRGSAAITVAVIDTGVDPNHPDLTGALLPGTMFVTSPDPSCAAGSTIDDNGHVRAVAGLIGANANNGIGIAGVAFGVKVLPIKALDCTGSGLLSDVASAVLWATDHGARIINISLGSSSAQQTLQDAIRYAGAHNVLVVAAAGNCGVISARCPTMNEPQYPGAYPESFAVAATDETDARAPFSNQSSYVAVAAPGVKIWSTTPTYSTTLSRSTPGTTSYAAFSGTSQAAPLVAGIAALSLSKDPTLTATQLADRLRTGADHLGIAGPNPDFGAGRVNAFRTVSLGASAIAYGASYDSSAIPSRAFTVAPISAAVNLTNSSTFTWTAAGVNPVHLSYHWFDFSGRTVVWDGQRSLLPADVPAGAAVTVNATIATPTTPGVYRLRLDLVREGIGWFSGNGVPTSDLAVNITSGIAASYAPAPGAPSIFVLGTNPFPVQVVNTGAAPWPSSGATPVRVSYHWLRSDGSVVVWDGARGILPADLAPGQSAVVTIPVLAPETLGQYLLRIDLVQEGVAWFSGQGVATRDFAIGVTNGFSASYAVSPLGPLQPGGRVALPVTLKNDGLAVWPAGGPNPIHIAAHVADGFGATVAWDGERSSLPNDVAPGQSVSTFVIVNAPVKAGSYIVRVDLVREGIAWLSSYGIAPATLALQDVEDYRATFQTGTATISRATPKISVTITNPSIATWSNTGPNPVDVSSHWVAADGTVLAWDGPRAALGQPVAPGASVTIDLPLASPPPGATGLVIDLVAEGLRWFGAGAPRPVTLVP
jgi:subtilisin family serine protease